MPHRRHLTQAVVLSVLALIVLLVVTILLPDTQTTWSTQQNILNQEVQQVSPEAVLTSITADGEWSPLGIQYLSVDVRYIQPTGEQLQVTFPSPASVSTLQIQQKPPEGPASVLPSFLQEAQYVQNNIRIGPEDAFRIAHSEILRFTTEQQENCRVADAGLVIDLEGEQLYGTNAYWVVMCTISPHYLSVSINPYTGTIINQTQK